MKRLIPLLFLAIACSSTQLPSGTVKQVNNVYFMQKMPAEDDYTLLANLLNDYIGAVTSNKYDQWYQQFSDSTITRVAPHKFPNKFNRLKEYGFTTDTLKVIAIEPYAQAFENETGKGYSLTIGFSTDLNVANRVGFDPLKRTEENTDPRKFGMDVIRIGDEYRVFIHKYRSGSGPNKQKN